MTNSEKRNQLFAANVERIEQAIQQGLTDGLKNPVAIVAHAGDPGARIVMETQVAKEEIERRAAQAARDKADLCLIWPISHADAGRSFSHASEGALAVINAPRPEGVFLVVVMAFGGISWRQHAMP